MPTIPELEGRIRQLEAELAPFKNWGRREWFDLRMYDSRITHLKQMFALAILPKDLCAISVELLLNDTRQSTTTIQAVKNARENSMRKLFVYGTLKQGFPLHSHLKNHKAKLLGEAKLQKTVMLKLGWFPGVVDGEGEVSGELYDLPEEAFKTLDIVEGHPVVFKRETRTVHMGDVGLDSEVYIFQRETGNEIVITEGVWK